jgi:hypothetical protein
MVPLDEGEIETTHLFAVGFKMIHFFKNNLNIIKGFESRGGSFGFGWLDNFGLRLVLG